MYLDCGVTGAWRHQLEEVYHVGNDAVSQQACVCKVAPQTRGQEGSHRPVILKVCSQLGVANAAKHIVCNCVGMHDTHR